MSANKSSSHSPHSINTLIGPSTRIEGDIRCNGVLRVQGEVHGNVSCDAGPEGALVVDAAGSVVGTVHATHVAVRGRVIGPLQSSDSIEIHQGGSVAGDVLFQRLAIHAGGIVEGLLKSAQAPGNDAAAPPLRLLPEASAAAGMPRSAFGVSRSAVAAAALVIVIAAVAAWFGRAPANAPLPSDDIGLKADASLHEVRAPAAADTAEIKPHGEPAVDAAPAVPMVAAEAAKDALPTSASGEDGSADISTVRGANPHRPAGVFLLVTHEPTVIYRKKRNAAGEGARITVGDGQRVGVSIARDDIVRVAKGSDVEIFFQGQKVPRQFITGGAWIAFVAR